MKTIVMNTESGAVTEYTRFDFHSITPTHAGSAMGLFELGGAMDADLPIVGQVRTPATLRDASLKNSLDMMYFSIKGEGQYQAQVFGAKQSWQYLFTARDSGQSRAQPGMGIRENYLGFGFSNPGGQPFSIDRIEVLVRQSKTRRV